MIVPGKHEKERGKQANSKLQSGTCQCTQDRKNTGSLFFPSLRITPYSAFRWTTPTETLKHYSATPAALRGFCANCGSFLYWRRAESDSVSLAVGTIDPLYLIGEGADGTTVPKGGFGSVLVNGGGGHEWIRNTIPGVTDNWEYLHKGQRWDGDEQ
jgi:hypothetical protein